MNRLRVCAVAALATSFLAAAAKGPGPADLEALLKLAGQRVKQYYAHARTVLCTEKVSLQPLDLSWTPKGFPRRIVDELRVEWNPHRDRGTARALVRRRILSINGRPPRKNNDNPDAACMDPRQVSPEPLEFLLPSQQDEYTFKWAGTGRVDGRPAAKIDYRLAGRKPASVSWKGDCVSVDTPNLERGRVWVGLASGEVLRLDQHLAGPFDIEVPPKKWHFGEPTWMELEIADSSIHYKPVTFHDPDETLMLPSSIESLQVVRNAGVPRLRTTQEFTHYRRFLTSGKIVVPPNVP